MRVRHADPARDGRACAEIYAPAVLDGVASFEAVAPTAAEMSARIRTTSAGWPWLVCEIDGVVVGYAYASAHRARSAYRWSTDVTVYVDASHHRRGIGRALYEPLLGLLDEQGFHAACAGITLPNPGSVALHESLGFTPVGVYREIGFKRGRGRDVGWWQRALRDGNSSHVPAPPGPPGRLAE
jgi:L-amino acid N-acyltransferase YncA